MKEASYIKNLTNIARAIWPLLRLTLAFFVVALIAILSLRQHGLQKEYSAPNHALFKPGFVVISHQGGAAEAPGNTQAAFDQTQSLSPEIWLHVDIQQCADGLVAFHGERLERSTDGEGWLMDKSFSELQKLNAGYRFGPEKGFPFRHQNLRILSLDQVLEKYPKATFVLDIHSNLRDIHKRIVEAVERHKADQRVLIQSDFDVILSSIKELRPMWLFGTGTRDLTRSHLLTSLFIESQAPMLGDVLLIPHHVRGRQAIPPRLVTEVHRRAKKLFAQDVDTAEAFASVQVLPVDGIMTDRPSALWPLVQQKPQ